MKKTAQELHNDQLKDLSKGMKDSMTITEAKELAELKEQTIKQENKGLAKQSFWPKLIIGIILLIMLVFAIFSSYQWYKNLMNEPTEQMRQRARHNNNFIP